MKVVKFGLQLVGLEKRLLSSILGNEDFQLGFLGSVLVPRLLIEDLIIKEECSFISKLHIFYLYK